jgi:hypothetical protein
MAHGESDEPSAVRSDEPSASLFFAQWPIRPPITRHCYSSGRRGHPETTGTIDFGSNPLAIWEARIKRVFRFFCHFREVVPSR